MIWIREYAEQCLDEWNRFIKDAKNSLFMHNRNYMDYHKDRFKDNSLMFYDDNRLIAIFPANYSDGVLVSHGGLTFGGFISDCRMTQETMNGCFAALKRYVEEHGMEAVLYKTIPHIYHRIPAEEDMYALYISDFKVKSLEAATAINLSEDIRMKKGRKSQISRAIREDISVRETVERNEYAQFIEMENEVLEQRHGKKAVHTAEEIYYLHENFPNHIRLFAAYKDEQMIAGSIIFEYQDVIHTQYMASNEKGRLLGGLDLVIKSIIDKYKGTKKWLDFGISTENMGRYLNEGLISQKEGFGGRTIVYQKWEWSL